MVKNKYNYNGKFVLITGGTSGIGLALTKILINKCKYVAIIGRSEKNLSSEVLSLLNNFNNISFFEYDLKNIKGINQLIDNIENKFNSTIDVVFNCAGYSVLGTVDQIPIEAYLENFNVNFFSSVVISKRLLKHLKEKNSGQLIFINSGVGKRGLPGVSSYSSTKFALNGFCESLRVELFEYNIDVIVVSPGLVKSNFTKNKKLFGNLKNYFDTGIYNSPNYVANKIYKAGIYRKRELSLSLQTKIGVLLSQNFPKLIDNYLFKKYKK